MRGPIIMLVSTIIAIVVIVCVNVGNTEETKNLEAVVINCEEGRYVEDVGMSTMSTYNMASGNVAMSMAYGSAAKNLGTQMYDITVLVDGEEVVVERDEEVDCDDVITIEKVITRNRNGEVKKIEYR